MQRRKDTSEHYVPCLKWSQKGWKTRAEYSPPNELAGLTETEVASTGQGLSRSSVASSLPAGLG